MEKVAEGLTKAVLEFTTEKIPDLVKKFNNREVAFIENRANIELVKKQREAEEYKLLQKYVKNQRLLVLMGLALRDIERHAERVQDLKDKIYGKYGKKGVHIVELVQIGLVTELLTRLVKIFENQADIENTMTSFLDQSEDLALFIKKDDEKKVDRIAELVVERVDVNPAHMMILCASGYAMTPLKAILRKIGRDPRDYLVQVQYEGPKMTAFVIAPELKEKMGHWSDTLAEGKKAIKPRKSR